MILLDISGADAALRKQGTLTCGMVGAKVRFRFDEAWEGLGKTAVFRCGKVTRDSLLTGDTAVIPHEVLTVPGLPLQIGVYGTDPGGTVVIPTVWAVTCPVLPGADPSGDPGADPTLPIWEQLREQISAPVRAVNVTLPAALWEASGSRYSQQVLIPGVTSGSQVNLTPTVAQMAVFCERDCCFLTENDGGTVTVYLFGEKPTEDYTVQACVVEVRT